jgi:hypothetical protein
MKVEDKTLFLKPILGKSASKASQKPTFSSNALRITNNTVQEGFKRNITLAAKKYTFSFFMDKGLEDLNDKEYFSVDILNSTNAIVYTYTTKVNATGYYNFDYSATTAGTYTWRFRRVSLNGRSSGGIAYFDDFKVSYTVQQSQQVCSSPKNYRFGFNTQEKDDEVYGAGNLNTAEFWEYDTRLGRRWNVDQKPKVEESPYATFANNPILFTDVQGDSAVSDGKGGTAWEGNVTDQCGETFSGKYSVEDIRDFNYKLELKEVVINKESQEDNTIKAQFMKEGGGGWLAYAAYTAVQNIWPVGRAMNKSGFYGNENDLVTGEKLELDAKSRLIAGGGEIAGFIALPRTLIFNTTFSINEMSNHSEKRKLSNVNEIGRGYTAFSQGLYKVVTAKSNSEKWLGIGSMIMNIKKMYTETKDLIKEEKKIENQAK